ncbi:MAG TPA: hypothetical protein VFW39_04115, partial [Sphingomicrobium sp.]|nr:hypothetical protein [Sphingomicrobium sp.]
MSSKRLWIVAAATVALGACNTANTHIGDEDPFLGESVKYDEAIQTINPAPVYPANAAQPGDNGDKGAQAVARYRNGAVKAPAPIQTTSITGGGG